MAGKTALVLSAGGMFGAYQTGVWKHLARVLQPDIVVGSSVGALNGWEIASGIGPEELQEHWFRPETAGMLRFRERPSLRSGYFDPAALLARVAWMHGEYRPKVPFGLTLVRLPWMHQELVRSEEVRPEHLLATCSILLFFPSVCIRGRRYTDGALLESMPIWAAARMGATRIIAIDSMPSVSPLWYRACCRGLQLFGRTQAVPAGVEIQVIRPSEPLGSALDAVVWKHENIQRWMRLGERDAREAIPLQ